jgi:hypothetical protein
VWWKLHDQLQQMEKVAASIQTGSKTRTRSDMPCYLLHGRTAALRYDAFEDIGTIFRYLEWKTPIFSGRVVPKTPNAS